MKVKLIIAVLPIFISGCVTQQSSHTFQKSPEYKHQSNNPLLHRTDQSAYKQVIEDRNKFIQGTNPHGFPPL